MPTYRFLQLDVFTDRAFTGNPLAVFPEAEGLSDELMMQIARGKAQQLADLGPDAIHARVSPQADAVAFERSGAIFVQPLAGSATFVGDGAWPRFAPDGQTILVERAGGSVLFSRGGVALAGMASQAGFAPCDAECEQ